LNLSLQLLFPFSVSMLQGRGAKRSKIQGTALFQKSGEGFIFWVQRGSQGA
jgi:hypothetical protein